METVPDVSPEVPPRVWRLLLGALERLPQRAMSRSFARVADLHLPVPLRGPILGAFARSVGVDLTEAEHPLTAYPSLDAFFVRRLRPGARTWPDTPAIAAPVDGVIGAVGRATEGRAVQAKGHDYALSELLGDADDAAPFMDGSYVTVYLSPRDYHRIHTPAPGSVRRAVHLPGTLLPVNAPAVMHIPGLFVRNERLVCHIESALGRIAVVAVGAYNVGRISAEFDSTWSPGVRVQGARRPAAAESIDRRIYDPGIPLETGDEIMAFHLGSTIVLLVEPTVRLQDTLRSGQRVRVGQPISD